MPIPLLNQQIASRGCNATLFLSASKIPMPKPTTEETGAEISRLGNGFDPSALKLLGQSYCNDFPVELLKDSEHVSIAPPSSTWRSMVIMSALIGTVCGGTIWFLASNASLSTSEWEFILFVVIVATFGPVLAHQFRLRYLRERSPLIACCLRTGEVSILAGEHRFTKEEVYALLVLSMKDTLGEFKSELQLIIRKGESFKHYLVSTSIFGSVSHSFGGVAGDFAQATGLLLLAAEPEGLLDGGPLRVTEVWRD